MLFGSMFDDNPNSSRTGEDNEVEEMRKKILQNLNDAQEYAQDVTKATHFEFNLDEHGQLSTICHHIVMPDYEDSTDYYKLFWKLFLTNEIQLTELNHLQSQTQSLKHKVSTIDVFY
jgi:hypothetical protein